MTDVELAWSLFGKFAVALGVVVGVMKAVEYIKSKAPTTKLQEDVKDLTTRVEVLEQHANGSMNSFEQLTKSINLLGLGLSSVISHLIDDSGNSKEELKKERDTLTKHFFER